MSASLWGHLPAVQFLLDLWPESISLFAKVDSFNDYLTGGGTCVHYAAVGGSVEVLDFLLDRKPEGAQVKDGGGAQGASCLSQKLLFSETAQARDLALGRNIPLHWAAAAGSLATARRLLERWPESGVLISSCSPVLFGTHAHILPEVFFLLPFAVTHNTLSWPTGRHQRADSCRLLNASSNSRILFPSGDGTLSAADSRKPSP